MIINIKFIESFMNYNSIEINVLMGYPLISTLDIELGLKQFEIFTHEYKIVFKY